MVGDSKTTPYWQLAGNKMDSFSSMKFCSSRSRGEITTTENCECSIYKDVTVGSGKAV